jgi:hypothetical protein
LVFTRQEMKMAKREASTPEKRDGLVFQAIGDEFVVYDPKTHQAHSLNRAAALVFEQVDGKADSSEIARKVGDRLGGKSSDRVVEVALDRLGKAGLLTTPASSSRRALLRGLAVALVPVVTTVLVPRAAAAASCVPLGGTGCVLGASSNCCSGFCYFEPYGGPSSSPVNKCTAG